MKNRLCRPQKIFNRKRSNRYKHSSGPLYFLADIHGYLLKEGKHSKSLRYDATEIYYEHTGWTRLVGESGNNNVLNEVYWEEEEYSNWTYVRKDFLKPSLKSVRRNNTRLAKKAVLILTYSILPTLSWKGSINRVQSIMCNWINQKTDN